MQTTEPTSDIVYKRPARFSLRLAFLQAALLAVLVISLFKYIEFKSTVALCAVVFLPVLSVVIFANFTRRHAYVLSASEQTLARFVQWYWFTPGQTECHSFSDVAGISVDRYDGEETWWVVGVVLRDDRRFELTADRNREKSNQVQADLEQRIGGPVSSSRKAEP